MKLDVIKLDASPAGSIELDDAVFGLEPRADILHRVVRWQLAKRQAGTHSTLGKSEVNYSTKKIYRQKGTGGARHGSRKAPIFRKGGTYKGPVPRSHAHDLNKKFRALGLRHALSAKAGAGKLIVLDDGEPARGEDQAAGAGAEGPRLEAGAGHRRRRGRTRTSPAPRATSRGSTCCRRSARTSTTSCAATRWS